jgi:hypothetical protein
VSAPKVAESRNTPPALTCKDCDREIAEVSILSALAVVTYGGTYCEPCWLDDARARANQHPIFGHPDKPGWSWPSGLALSNCGWCGRPVRGGIPSYSLRFCCDDCVHEDEKARRRVVHEPRACTECGQLFTPARADAEYHSAACKQRAYRRRRATNSP